MLRDRQKTSAIKSVLLERLKQENAFWSYARDSVSTQSISDEQLIALTLKYLDLPEIDMLFSIYSKTGIKDAWRNQLIPEGEYLYTLNRFLAWYYFDIKRPDTYLKAMQTRRLNKLLNPQKT